MRIPGVTHRANLPALGITEVDRRRMLRLGEMTRLGTWYVTQRAPPELLTLLGQGIRPTCVTAAEHHDLWVPDHDDLHVYRPRGIGDAISSTEVELTEHAANLRRWPNTDPVPDLPLALAHAARCLPVRDTAILFESALNTRKLSMRTAQSVISSLPHALRDPLRRINPRAESGTETAVRWWLESLRVPVTPQVSIRDVGRVDLRVGTSWIIECDSVKYHDKMGQFHTDRARDLRLKARRYLVTRLTWEQVFLNWEETKPYLLDILRRRDHRRPLPR